MACRAGEFRRLRQEFTTPAGFIARRETSARPPETTA